LTDSSSRFVSADGRRVGAQCRHCSGEVFLGDSIAVCPRCGGVNHETCWQQRGGCGSYECAPARRVWGAEEAPTLRVTTDDLAAARPLPVVRGGYSLPAPDTAGFAPEPASPRANRMAIASLLTALLGIPLFGVVTGLVATILGSIALGTIHQTRQRGRGLALAGVLLGIADVVGWVIFLSLALSHPGSNVQLGDFEPDPTALENLPPHISRALRANALIETRSGWRGAGIGAGVVLRIEDGTAIIVTNRHVVDPDFSPTASARASAPSDTGQLQVKLLGAPVQPGKLLWIAPDGIDLALLSVSVDATDVKAAPWREKPRLVIGDDVFSIGNPQHLDWSHSRGVVSQFRVQTCGLRKVRIIQTDTAINPGNSGGGLYDKEGMLVGINTWTNDKRFSEGLSFAVAVEVLWDLDPPPLRSPAKPKEWERP